jgi:hypothetical protein
MLYFFQMERQELIKKIEQLPPDRLAAVENFVESLEHRDSDENKLNEALAEFVAKYAGTELDLDPALEGAAVQHLLEDTSR